MKRTEEECKSKGDFVSVFVHVAEASGKTSG